MLEGGAGCAVAPGLARGHGAGHDGGFESVAWARAGPAVPTPVPPTGMPPTRFPAPDSPEVIGSLTGMADIGLAALGSVAPGQELGTDSPAT